MEKVKPVCKYCGSDDISADATARWDMKKQKWVLTDVMDNYTCEDCNMDSRINYVKVDQNGNIIEKSEKKSSNDD